METITNEKQTLTTSVHTFEPHEPYFPFSVVKFAQTEEEKEISKKFKIALGNALVDENEFETLEDALEYIEEKPYSLILALICHSIELHDNYKTQDEQIKQQKENENKC